MKIIENILRLIMGIILSFLSLILLYVLFIIGSFVMLPEGHCDDPENAYDFECVD